ncbi:uncharacterized protein [Diadema setosum]|uniref:uncharacterized protein n=1 Tax=Diadema setosum TaxID=31175 RepID=UPI003B3BA18B
MSGRLQSSSHADKLRLLNTTLEKQYTSQIAHLDRQRRIFLSQFFRDMRNVEEEYRRRRNAKLTDPIPKRLLGDEAKPNITDRREVLSVGRTTGSASPHERLRMRQRSSSEGDLAEQRFRHVYKDQSHLDSQAVAEAKHSLQPTSVSLGYPGRNMGRDSENGEVEGHSKVAFTDMNRSRRRKVHFEDQKQIDSDHSPAEAWSMTELTAADHESVEGIPAGNRILDSARALAVYRRLQRKVQDSLEHGNKSKHPEAAVESTMKLMKRRQQRKMREDDAEKRKGKQTYDKGRENLERAQKDNHFKTRNTHAWWNRQQRRSSSPSTRKEAYALPSLSTDHHEKGKAAKHLSLTDGSASNKLKSRAIIERETKLYFSKLEQTAENERVTKKINAYLKTY